MKNTPERSAASGRAAAIASAFLASACTALLPTSETSVAARWDNFDEAKAAVERIDPGRTSAAEVRALGFDPYADPNVELLSYSDILRRFPTIGTRNRLDPGLAACLEAGSRCSGYAIEIRRSKLDRVGNFFLDVLNFRRETKTTGWSFYGLVLIVDERAVYALYGGKPALLETGHTVTPLGPLQDWNGSQLVR